MQETLCWYENGPLGAKPSETKWSPNTPANIRDTIQAIQDFGSQMI